MGTFEPLKVVNQRILKLESEHIARKVLHYVHLQYYTEEEIMWLAYGPESAIQNLIIEAKAALQLSSTAVDFPPISPSVNPIRFPNPSLQYALFSSAPPRPPLLPPRRPVTCYYYFNKGFCRDGNNCKYFHGQYLPKNYSHNFGPKTNEDAPKYLAVGAATNDPGLPVSGSHKIYLTFKTGSTFTKKDASNYFSTFGAVEEVRFPFYQRPTFGFVTFVSSDTVEFILARGNPHYIRGDCVFVKPCREKSDLLERKLDSYMYSSHHVNSKIQAEKEKQVEVEQRRLFNLNRSQITNANESYFDRFMDELRVVQEQVSGGPTTIGHQAEINHSDADSRQLFELPENIFGSAEASTDSSEL